MDAWAIILIVFVALNVAASSIRIVKQYERGLVFRFGRLVGIREPGFNLILPFLMDRMTIVSLRISTMVLEPQEVITKDNVTVKVDAVVYFMVLDPERAVINVEDYRQAMTQLAQTTMRSVLGQSELDELLAHRDEINRRLREIIDEQSEEPWGVRATMVEVKDVLLPDTMQRAMAKQAEAEREKRAKVIHAEGEKQAATALAEAAEIIQTQPAALQLRYMQTLVELAGEHSSTIIPLPMDIFGALSRMLDQGGR